MTEYDWIINWTTKEKLHIARIFQQNIKIQDTFHFQAECELCKFGYVPRLYRISCTKYKL